MSTIRADAARYDRVAIGLHWLSALLVLAAIALIEVKGWFPRGDALRDGVKLWHFQLGVLVLLATCCRIAWRAAGRRPEPAAPRGSRQARLAAAAHGVLYLLLLALPLSGLAVLVAAGKPVSLFGWELPLWAEGSKAAAKTAKRLHETAGNLMIALVAAHVGAALWHRFVRRDGVLARMLPARGAH
ncbi:cytochrome b [Azospira restricta]|uniref:Cytochrome b n=1 Tax=Azospira restricta TaxID=404405 RepID=A0A974SN84_9RHOO|nr:cytochrome b [Azospira restricta]QRJ63039.1 cytochrome b [Azospira restricta]